MHSIKTAANALAALALSLTTAYAHSWIEQLDVIAPNGTFVGAPGFARGNVQRQGSTNVDQAMVYLLPPNGRDPTQGILPSDTMCFPGHQQQQTQTGGSDRLKAAPGDMVALRYQENGHVSLPQNQPGKPDNRGTIYVYGTTQSSPDDKFLDIHQKWNADGTGGDKKGKLLATLNYDDSQCYQINGGAISVNRQKQFSHTADKVMGADLWCQSDIQLPADAPTGKPYTLYWVWDWPTAKGTPGVPNGKAEVYTTCMDIDVNGQPANANKAAISFQQGQDRNYAAVPAQIAAIAAGKPFMAPTSGSGQQPAASAPPNAPAAPAPAPTLSNAQKQVAPPTAAAPKTVTVSAPAVTVTKTVAPTAVAPTAAAAAPTQSVEPGVSSITLSKKFQGVATPVASPMASGNSTTAKCKKEKRSKIFKA